MPIRIDYTPVRGVAELARRGGQQQQAVREQGFQWQQDLIGLQANLQQKRDVMLNQFQQQQIFQQQQYEISQQERRYQVLRSEARKDRKFQEEMAELEIKLYKDRQKFDIQLENEQYVAKRKFDFNQELQGMAAESQFRMQLEQQKIMGDLAEQQMKTQQKERESEAAIKAIQENAYLSPEEQARAITAYQTKISSLTKAPKQVSISTKALQLAASTGQDPQFAQDMLAFVPTLPNELQDLAWEAFRNPEKRQEFYDLYQAWGQNETQKLAQQYGLAPQQETPQQRLARRVPPWRANSAELTRQWDYDMSPVEQQREIGKAAGIRARAQKQITVDEQKDFNKALNDYISANEKLEDYAMKGAMAEALTGKESRAMRALEFKRDRALARMREIDPVAAENIQTQVEQKTQPSPTASQTREQTSPYKEYPDAYFENGNWYVIRNGQRYRIEE